MRLIPLLYLFLALLTLGLVAAGCTARQGSSGEVGARGSCSPRGGTARTGGTHPTIRASWRELRRYGGGKEEEDSRGTPDQDIRVEFVQGPRT